MSNNPFPFFFTFFTLHFREEDLPRVWRARRWNAIGAVLPVQVLQETQVRSTQQRVFAEASGKVTERDKCRFCVKLIKQQWLDDMWNTLHFKPRLKGRRKRVGREDSALAEMIQKMAKGLTEYLQMQKRVVTKRIWTNFLHCVVIQITAEIREINTESYTCWCLDSNFLLWLSETHKKIKKKKKWYCDWRRNCFQTRPLSFTCEVGREGESWVRCRTTKSFLTMLKSAERVYYLTTGNARKRNEDGPLVRVPRLCVQWAESSVWWSHQRETLE